MNYIRYTRQSAGALNAVVQYVEQERKTMRENGEQLVSGINCSPSFANREFLALRQLYHKESPHWFYHYTRSFHPEEKLDCATAHRQAIEFAERAWPGCQVLVATHIDAAHIHSHFLVNAVRFDDGKMLRIHKGTLGQLRQLSDELCERHGLSLLPSEHPRQGKGMDTREYRSAEKGQSWKMQLVIAIEDCMCLARSREHFLRLMKRRGYGVRWEDTRKSITYTTPTGMKCRDLRLHEDKFLKEMMELEFRIREEIFGGAEGSEQEADGASRGKPAGRGASAGGGVAGSDRREVGGTEPDAGLEILIGGNPPGAGEDRLGLGEAALTTGWEKERETLIELALEPDLAQPDMASADSAGDRLMGDLLELGYAVAESQRDVSVRDSTTMHRRKKTKRAPGEKPEPGYEQSM